MTEFKMPRKFTHVDGRGYVVRVSLGQDCGKCKRCRKAIREGRSYVEWKWCYWHVGYATSEAEAGAMWAESVREAPWDQHETTGNGKVACEHYVTEYIERMADGRLLTSKKRPFKASSLRTLSSDLRAFQTHEGFEGKGLDDITQQEARRWAENPRTSANAVQAVIAMYNRAVKDGEATRNPFLGRGKQTNGRKGQDAPSTAAVEALLDACAVHGDYAPMMRAFLTFGAWTLCRPGELFSLDWCPSEERDGRLFPNYVSFENEEVVIGWRLYPPDDWDTPKGGEARTIPLLPQAMEALRPIIPDDDEYPEPEGPVFRNKVGGRLIAPTFSDYWQEVKLAAGYAKGEGPSPYECMKHYGYQRMRQRLSKEDVAAMTGWKESTIDVMDEVYGWGKATRERMAFARIREAFAENVAPIREALPEAEPMTAELAS